MQRIIESGENVFDVVIESEINSSEDSVSAERRRQSFVESRRPETSLAGDLAGGGEGARLMLETDPSLRLKTHFDDLSNRFFVYFNTEFY